MTLSAAVLIIFTGAVCSSAAPPLHDFHYIYGCYEPDEVWVDVLVDGDVAAYADFNKEEVVWMMPHQPKSVKDFLNKSYEIAKAALGHCHSVLGIAKRADPGAPMRQDAPGTFIYTRYEEEEGVLNTLFCLANHFYPPTINFTWLRNEVPVTEGVLNLRYRHNNDGTFHRISTLTFTPTEGDVYTCTVEHQALSQPLTKSWELRQRKSSVSPAVVFFCVSIVLCLMGIGAGAFFATKQPE
ncbi:H-2 class II histocompatibility antigen, A-Q alpha chain-like [Mastacembelus armatus]|uniref:H-2 class II histocompatibility antigen, A-Q alpha chain-like n=1 Tax=Mastacembelus armatus TaxID=205130 RepID=A0A3Q3S7A6_9TELE|nr:H-2 class II histocompatibility antigen, A-Q alpha chain-like [Mastacembelus armatus]XP_026162497.1 H-2 class II histocompatibility antigen, A-Q alpha chain-like [Mastacembelus armatus]